MTGYAESQNFAYHIDICFDIEYGWIFIGFISQENADRAEHHGAKPFAEPGNPFSAFCHFFSWHVDDIIEDENGDGYDNRYTQTSFADDGSKRGTDKEEEQAG